MGPGTVRPQNTQPPPPTPTPRERWAAQGSQAGPGSQGWSPPSKIHFKNRFPLSLAVLAQVRLPRAVN